MGREVKVNPRSVAKEMREHPWATKAVATRIALDHAKERRGKGY